MLTIAFAVDRPSSKHVFVLPVLSADGAARALPASLKGGEALVAAALEAARFTAEAGTLVDVHVAEADGVTHLLIIGLGTARDGIKAGGAIVARLLTSGATSAVVDLSHIASADRAALAAGIAEAASLRSWRQDAYRTKLTEKQKPTLSGLTIVVGDRLDEATAAWASRQAVVEGVAFTRMLVTEPPNLLYPQTFVEHALSGRELGLEIEVLGEREMRQAGMGALLGVAQGSEREAQLLVMRWDGTDGAVKEPTAFVGKGVTFDSGGISLKPPAGMEDMKWDMGGAGAVAGVMRALASRKALVHVVGICGLVENMPDGKAQRPGDVVTSMSGQTIEVINTDAEGRLVLCDAITWVQRRFKPKTIVDLATLTGAMIISLGHEHGGIFANDDALAEALVAAGKAVDEKLWRMPMGDAYDKLIDSPIADMKNVGPREAGSITAAQFIARFLDEGVKWAHLDIAGMVWAAKAGTTWEKGATGFGVRLLDRYVKDVLEG